MADTFYSAEDIAEQVNLVEKLLSGLGPQDEYNEAIVRNQQMILDTLLEMKEGEYGQAGTAFGDGMIQNTDNLPVGLVGTSTEEIPSGEVGAALFSLNGSNIEARVRMESGVDENDVIVIKEENNVARPALGQQSALAMLTGAAAGGKFNPIQAERYRVYETSEMEAAGDNGLIQVDPGERVTFFDTGPLNDPGFLMAIGATDEMDVEYRVEVDGDRSVGGFTNSPLGSINTPFSFIDEFGGAIPVFDRVQYTAQIPRESNSSAELAARAHLYQL